jgi:hypothetical protein
LPNPLQYLWFDQAQSLRCAWCGSEEMRGSFFQMGGDGKNGTDGDGSMDFMDWVDDMDWRHKIALIRFELSELGGAGFDWRAHFIFLCAKGLSLVAEAVSWFRGALTGSSPKVSVGEMSNFAFPSPRCTART